MDIVIDFDGTVVTHAFPEVGQDIGAVPVLKALVENGHNLILFTMRSDQPVVETDDPSIHPEAGDYLTQAVDWFRQNDIPLYGIQTNPTQSSWTSSPKAYGQIIIDDAALGCPLIHPKDQRPFVDWKSVAIMLCCQGLISWEQATRICERMSWLHWFTETPAKMLWGNPLEP